MATDLISAQLANSGAMANSIAEESRYLCFGSFYLDRSREELFKDGARIKMPGKVYQALITLLEQPGEVVSREALRSRLWPEGTYVNYDANVNTTVNKLRLALGDSPEQPVYVETIPRQGYCFVARVEKKAPEVVAAVAEQKTPEVAETETPAVEKRSWSLPNGSSATWAKVAAVALVISGMLFGAAIVLYTHHG